MEVQSGIAVGGTLRRGHEEVQGNVAIVGGEYSSLIRASETQAVNFLSGVDYGPTAFDSEVSFFELEFIARHAVTSLQGNGVSVVVIDQGCDGDTYTSLDLINPAPGQTIQGEDHGRTLAIFVNEGVIRETAVRCYIFLEARFPESLLVCLSL